MKSSLPRTLIATIFVAAFTWQCIGAWQDSQTTDEAVHLTAGRVYWQTGDFSLNPEHPILFKLWAAWPLTWLPATAVETSTEAWRSQSEWLVGIQYLYDSPTQVQYGSQGLMFIGRLPLILVWFGFLLTLTIWSWHRWGGWPAAAVAALFAFDPNLLGHGHLVTNDLAMAWAFFGLCVAIDRFTQRPSWSRWWWLTLVFAVAQQVKYSAAILWFLAPLLLLIGYWYRRPIMTGQWWWRASLGFLAVSAVVGWGVYGFHLDRIDRDPRIAQLWSERREIVEQHRQADLPGYTQFFVRISDPQSWTGRLMERAQHLSVPAYWYWRGFFSVLSHNANGHGAFLLGQKTMLGWWYYFPVALAVKTPILLLGLTVIGLAMGINRLVMNGRQLPWRQRWPADLWWYVAPPILYLLWSLTSHINIGVRHVFPAYVFSPLIGGYLVWRWSRSLPRWQPLIAVIITTTSVTVATLAWPHTIGYYNGLIGGTSQGHRYVIDSNIDWNQDIWRLRHFLDRQQFPIVHLALFGSIPREMIFPETQPIPEDADIAAGTQPTDIIAISAGQLYNLSGPFAWLRAHHPRWMVGTSIAVYDFR